MQIRSMGCICFKEARRKAREDAEAHNSAMQHAASSPVHDLQVSIVEFDIIELGLPYNYHAAGRLKWFVVEGAS